MPGVSVLVVGSNKGASTDGEGKYTLQLTPAETSLTFSFIGYKTVTVEVGDRTVVDVVLEADAQALDEVVIVGYGTMQEKDLTSAITTVKTDELTKTPTSQPMQALQGKIPGVQVVSSGAPGASPTVRIRGIGSMPGQGNSDPLYVVEEGQMVEQQRRRSLVGASFARPAGDWVVRGDLVHLFNEPLQTPEGAENVPKSAALLGLDLTRNEWTVNLQATVSHRHGAPDSLPRETGWEASAAVLKDWSKQRLNAGILWLYNREVQSSHMVKANLGYRCWNQWYLETGYIAFSGGQTTRYGQFDNRDRLYLQVRRDFGL